MLNYGKLHMNMDDIFTKKAKNDDETSNGHKTALECPIWAYDDFSESLRKYAWTGDSYAVFQNSELPKNEQKSLKTSVEVSD